LKVAIVGGGINGLSCAWSLAREKHQVTLFEKDNLMQQTSRASSKLLHGGLRYLENREFRLVREALRERDAWFARDLKYIQPLRLVVPIYNSSRRGRWMMGAGLYLYKLLAGNSCYGDFRWLPADKLAERDPMLNVKGLRGGYEFFDGMMDDYKLGLWVAEQARNAGAQLYDHTAISKISSQGEIAWDNGVEYFDRVINVAGPWAIQLSKQSNYDIPYQLDLIRGSHIVIGVPCEQAYFLEVPGESRIFFILPWKGKTLIGTTEVRQKLDEPIKCSDYEEAYLLKAYNHYRNENMTRSDIVERFSGLRPLVKSAADPTRTTREYVIHRNNKLVTVLGGKWTTSLALARQVSNVIR
jgi:glycerol-3-phosphate dehydrogenase